MTEIQPPSYLQNGAHSAMSDRLTVSALLQPGGTGLTSRGGVKASSDGNGMAVVAAGTANNTVTVRAGTCFVVEADSTGVYVCHNDSDRVLTVSSASTTQARRDIVVAQVNDSTFSGVSDNWALTTVQGTPSSGTPVAPAVPNNALVLAEYLVPAGSSTNITNANITDRRANAAALGGVMSVLSTALPASPYRGMPVWCTDTEEIRVWNGTAWRAQSFSPLPDPALTWYNGVISITSAAQTFANMSPRLNLAFTASRAMWVLVHLHASLNSTTGNDVRASATATGATTGPGTGGMIQPDGLWGEILYTSQNISNQAGATIPFRVNAGTTTFEMRGWRFTTASAVEIKYPSLRITPLRYA